jgi:DNA-binding NtrC family response regulator
MQAKILIADDERHVAEGLQMLLTDDGYEVDMATDGQTAWEMIEQGGYALVLADLRMPEIDGLELFSRMREAEIGSEIIIITGKGSVDTAKEAMREGAYDYLEKPLKIDRLKELIPKAVDKYEVKSANRALEERLASMARFGDLIGQSDEMRGIYGTIEAAAPSTASILILGESGTGKELVARAIHDKSSRRKGPFIPINCGAFPRDILENELFGHEKGAFTGAIAEKPGVFELATGGTFVLAEVAEMEPPLQV